MDSFLQKCLSRKAWTQLLTAYFSLLVLARVTSGCPSDIVTETNACFTEYSFHFRNMHNSREKLCCGVDVEVLRAFCHSYMKAIYCVKNLKDSCPRKTHKIIDGELVNLDGAGAGLLDLCSDDSIIERYAMHQSCFTLHGRQSESCFRHLNTTRSGVRLLSKITHTRKDRFCSVMRRVVRCVERNIGQHCGLDAGKLAPVLVKPMVRESTGCQYPVIDTARKSQARNKNTNPSYVSDENTDSSKHRPETSYSITDNDSRSHVRSNSHRQNKIGNSSDKTKIVHYSFIISLVISITFLFS